MLNCLLCLQEEINMIKLSSEKGIELNCSSVISQHFWLKPNLEDKSTESVCLTCWNELIAFHKFYQSVAKAHNYFVCEVSNNSIVPEPEVKLEIEQLDKLPKIEVFETAMNYKLKPLVMQKQIVDLTTPLPEESINSEKLNKPLADASDEDSEIEVPLSMLKLSKSLRTETDLNGEFALIHEPEPLSSTSDKVATVIENDGDIDFPLSNQNSCGQESENKVSNNESHNKDNESDADDDPIDGETIPENNKHTKKYNKIISKYFEKLECVKCKLAVQTFEDLRQHFVMAHTSEPFVVCCGRTFQRLKTLSNHVLIHLNPQHLKCSQCHKVMKNSLLLQQHMEKNHQCIQCLKKFSNKKTLQHHLQLKHLIKLDYICRKCDTRFSTKHELRTHKSCIHGLRSTAICDQCGKHLSTRKSLRRHMLKHQAQHNLESGPVQCDVCGKWLKHRNTLRQHKNWVHEKRFDQQCPFCSKISTTRRALEMHIHRIHKSKKEFPCTMCKKVLKTKRELEEHTNVHTKEKQYTCEICFKSFDRKGSKAKHIKICHSGNSRRAQCEICNIWVASADYLKIHIKKMHEKNDALHLCPKCGKISVHEIALKRHMKRNHGDKLSNLLPNSNLEIQCAM